jgi:tight adherence protein B
MDTRMVLLLLVGAGCIATGLLGLYAWLCSDSLFLQRSWEGYRAWYHEQADYLLDPTPARHFAMTHAATAGAALLLGSLIFSSLLPIVGLGLVGIVAPRLRLQDRVRKRRGALIQQVDPALQLIANSLQVTPNVEGALLLVAQHMKPPIAQEMSRVVAGFRMGQSLDTALQGMADRCSDPFVTAMTIALIVGRRTGGNISATLRQIASTTREAVRVQKDMSSKTKGQRSQFYFVVALYPISLFAMRTVMPSGWETLTMKFQGRVALIGSLGIIMLATFWALSILNPRNLGGGNG